MIPSTDPIDPYEGIVLSRPIRALPENRPGYEGLVRSREACVIPLAFGRARIVTRFRKDMLSFEDGW